MLRIRVLGIAWHGNPAGVILTMSTLHRIGALERHAIASVKRFYLHKHSYVMRIL